VNRNPIRRLMKFLSDFMDWISRGKSVREAWRLAGRTL